MDRGPLAAKVGWTILVLGCTTETEGEASVKECRMGNLKILLLQEYVLLVA